ncbi:MAG: TlpA disulfide reductase family protein [Sulfurovum sp.]|nr:TlpA disulfide reductase family protein [Sulfurovum sp.]
MKNFFTTTLLLFLLLTFTQAADDKSTLVPMKMTDVTGKTYDIQGTEQGLKIKGLEGKVVFLEFFGHKCPPCLASIPHLIKLQKKHQDTLAIVSIEVQGYNHAQTAKFAKEKGMNYIVVSEEKASELVSYIQQRAQWRGSIPFLVALDPQGDVQFVQAGMLPEESLEDLIAQLSKIKK